MTCLSSAVLPCTDSREGSGRTWVQVALWVLVLSFTVHQPVAAQPARPINPAVLTEPWTAEWITHPEAPADSFGVFHFRRTFELDERPEHFVVHVSADNRYRLFINGAPISSGPALSDLMHWRFETVDLAPHLQPGRNVLAALVWNWGASRPVNQISYRTGFVLRGDTEREANVNTGADWKVFWNRGYSPIPVTGADIGNTYYAAPPGEALDAGLYPWGWEQLEFSDHAWPGAQAAVPPVWPTKGALPHGSHPYGDARQWQLVPRPIPPMEESTQRFARVRRTEGVSTNGRFLRAAGDLLVPPRTRAVLLLDQGYNTNGYTSLETSGGAGANLVLTYAESLIDADGEKRNRNEITGKTIRGVRDRIALDGGNRRRFRSLWFRTFRYVQVEIETADEALRIHDLHSIFTGYPFEERGSFSSNQAWLQEVWDIGWRTLRLCAWETYFDTPYYEQLQYVGDTRIQALISLYIAGDDRLMRNAIELFDRSGLREGITASRHPSHIPQFIPPYSLFWVSMVHDHWMLRDDPAWVRRFLPNVRGVLEWYERRVDESGLVGSTPWWNYVDSPAFPRGVPPGAESGNSTVITLQFAYTLRQAAELEEALGLPGRAAHYRALADSLGLAAYEHAWDRERRLFADTPAKQGFSQHANVLAVLAGVMPPGEEKAVMERVLSDTSLVQASYYFRFYVDEALQKVGLADRYIERLEPWREMLALGLTTTPEFPEPTRSDSHAWSAHPNYGLLATVLGVRPAEPGFRSVLIAPGLGPLQRAQGRIAHPNGMIQVQVVRRGREGIVAEVELPRGVGGTFEWNGSRIPLREGRQKIRL